MAIFWRLSICCLCLVCGCSDTWWKYGRHLDPIGRKLDEFGTISVSPPLLSPAANFKFELSDGPNEYYKAAREEIQLGVGTSRQRAEEFRGGLQLRADLQDLFLNALSISDYFADRRRFQQRQNLEDAATGLGLILPFVDPALALKPASLAGDGGSSGGATGSAEGEGADKAASSEPARLTPAEERFARASKFVEALTAASKNMSGPTSRPTLPTLENTPPEIDPKVLPEVTLTELLEDKKFRAFMDLYKTLSVPEGSLKVPPRAAISQAAGDTFIEGIFTFLGKPELAAKFKDKAVIVGIANVAVAPGAWTESDFAADVSVTIEYRYHPIRYGTVANYLSLQELTKEPDNPLSKDARAKTRVAIFEDAQNTVIQFNERLHPGGGKLATLQPPAPGLKPDKRATAQAEYARQVYARVAGGQPLQEHECNSPPSNYEPAPYPEQPYGTLFQIQQGHLVPLHASVGTPAVVSIAPLTEAQSFDFATSLREQKALALKLALALSGFGADLQGQALYQAVDRFQQDARQRGAINKVIGYGNASGMFGYHFTPEYMASLKPRHSAVERKLLPQSFPVVIFIGIDCELLGPVIHYDQALKRYVLVEPWLLFRQTSRWSPLKSPMLWAGISESERIGWAASIRDARRNVRNAYEAKPQPEDVEFLKYIRGRTDMLSAHMLEASSIQAIPLDFYFNDLASFPGGPESPKPAPSLALAVPDAIEVSPEAGSARIAFTGQNLKQLDLHSAVFVGPSGFTLSIADADRSANALVGTLTWNAGVKLDKPALFQLRLKYADASGQDAFLLTPVVALVSKVKPPEDKPKANVAKTELRRELEGPDGKRIEVIQMSSDGNADIQKLFVDRYKPATQPASTNVDVDVNVEANKNRSEHSP